MNKIFIAALELRWKYMHTHNDHTYNNNNYYNILTMETLFENLVSRNFMSNS